MAEGTPAAVGFGDRCIFVEIFGSFIYFLKIRAEKYKKIPTIELVTEDGFISKGIVYLSIYYNERRQLKTLLTQFGPVLPLTSDPPVRLHDNKKVERP
jgi:hypothetical protein